MNETIYEAFYLDGHDPGLGLITELLGGEGDDGTPPPPDREPVEDVFVDEGEPTPSGWPAAVPVRPANWNLDVQPAVYEIAEGDTLSGLSQTYMGTPLKWREIYDLNKPDPISNPDVIFAETVIAMPDEAANNMRAWLASGQPTAQLPGELSPEQKKKAQGVGGFLRKHKKKLLIGGGLAAAGGAGYLIYRQAK